VEWEIFPVLFSVEKLMQMNKTRGNRVKYQKKIVKDYHRINAWIFGIKIQD